MGQCGIAKPANPPLFPAAETRTAHTVAIMFRGSTTPLRAGQKVERTISGCFPVCLEFGDGSHCSNASLAWEVFRNLCRSLSRWTGVTAKVLDVVGALPLSGAPLLPCVGVPGDIFCILGRGRSVQTTQSGREVSQERGYCTYDRPQRKIYLNLYFRHINKPTTT